MADFPNAAQHARSRNCLRDTVASYSICDVLYWQHNIATQRDYAMQTCALFEI